MLWFVSLPKMSAALAPSWDTPIHMTIFEVYNEHVRKSPMRFKILFLVFINKITTIKIIN